jgi:hypothetical protein
VTNLKCCGIRIGPTDACGNKQSLRRVPKKGPFRTGGFLENILKRRNKQKDCKTRGLLPSRSPLRASSSECPHPGRPGPWSSPAAGSDNRSRRSQGCRKKIVFHLFGKKDTSIRTDPPSLVGNLGVDARTYSQVVIAATVKALHRDNRSSPLLVTVPEVWRPTQDYTLRQRSQVAQRLPS